MKHGFEDALWNEAKRQATDIMAEVARRRAMVTYTQLFGRVSSIHLDPHDPRVYHFLMEILHAEEEAGRPMLTVVVVHKQGDMEPGKGFYEEAARLGRDVSDQQKFWISELHRVHAFWSAR